MNTAPQQETPAPQPEDDNLEFKPWVKLTAWGAVGLGCLSLAYYAFYSWGYASGERSATARAEQSFSDLLQVVEQKNAPEPKAADGHAKLLQLASNPELFAGIENPILQRDARELLICTLIEGDMLDSAENMLREAMPPAKPETPIRARRMLGAASWLARHGKWEPAKEYLQAVEDAYAAWGRGLDAVLREHIELCGRAGLSREALGAELSSLIEKSAAGYPMLCAELHVYLGKLYREQGDHSRADAQFKEALGIISARSQSESELPHVCYGVALYETGDFDNAEKWLVSGLNANNPDDSTDMRAIALRHLATLSLEAGHPLDALRCLHRAEGEATGRIPKDNAFWLCLGDQRAWALYSMHEYEESLAEFRRVLAAASAAEYERLRAQPLEGEARCCLSLGLTQEAVQAAEACVALRERLMAGDPVSLGRVFILLGQAYDQAGQVLPAAEAYGRAAAVLPADHGGKLMALSGQAYALTQARRWQEAAQAWEALLPLLPQEDGTRIERVKERLETCRRKAESAARETPDKPQSE